MKEEARSKRQEEIEQAAYEVLEEHGYSGTSMLAIARQARASNETLYNWYGDKAGLFKALVIRNAAEIKALLEKNLKFDADPVHTLQIMGPKLLEVLTGPRAVALNRAAAADPTGELGTLIAREGRDTVAPMIGKILDRARGQGKFKFSDVEEAIELYLSLLVGDIQIRIIVGRMPCPDTNFFEKRSELAITRLKRLLSAS